MVKRVAIFLLLLVAAVLGAGYVYAFKLPQWFPFNKKNALDEWEEKVFRNKVLYVVETKHEGGYLSAKSTQAASGLVHRIKFNAQKYPMISWKWRVLTFPDKQKVLPKGETGSGKTEGTREKGWIEKDDYAARVYVIFYNWNFMNIKSLEYVWDESLPKGTILTSPFFRNIKILVAESGKDHPGEWVSEERNVYNDYTKAFGRHPSASVGAIALMTNSDNTRSTAEAEYKDIRVGYVQ